MNTTIWQRLALLGAGIVMAILSATLLKDSQLVGTFTSTAATLIVFAGGALAGGGTMKRPGDTAPPKPATLPPGTGSGMIVFLLCGLIVIGCTKEELQKNVQSAFDVAGDVMDVARSLCLRAGSERTGLSLADVHKQFCDTREQLEPWIGEAQQAMAAGAARTGMARDANGQ